MNYLTKQPATRAKKNFFCFCCHSATTTAETLCTKGKQRWWQMVGEWQQMAKKHDFRAFLSLRCG